MMVAVEEKEGSPPATTTTTMMTVQERSQHLHGLIQKNRESLQGLTIRLQKLKQVSDALAMMDEEGSDCGAVRGPSCSGCNDDGWGGS